MNRKTKEPARGGAGKDEETLAEVLAEAVERLRRGDRPAAAEYIEKHPDLESDILAGFEAMLALEDARGLPRAAWQGEGGAAPRQGPPQDASAVPREFSLEDLLAGLPPSVQRLIYLRCLEKRRWAEIAALVGEPEIEVRRAYASAIAEVFRRERAATADSDAPAR